jgi:serine/threonine protein kinase
MWTATTGTLFYKAPEMFLGSYTNKVDVWAVGILAYELLHGRQPFVS